jgi:hypothetical protein
MLNVSEKIDKIREENLSKMIPNTNLINSWLNSSFAFFNDVPSASFREIQSIEVRPPVVTNRVKVCSHILARHQFRNSYYNSYKGDYEPNPSCGAQWSQIVVTLNGRVSGRQYDRFGGLWVGGSEILRYTSTEPSGTPITHWSVQQDITRYHSIFEHPQKVILSLDNIVNEKYTGIFDIEVILDFYGGERSPDAADLIVSLSSSDENYGWVQVSAQNPAVSSVPRLPNNTIKSMVEVFISGHSQDEF